MVLSDKLTSLNTAKQNLKTAFTNKGNDMSSTSFTDYYTLINNMFTVTPNYYVSPTGSDSNNGLTPSTAFLTLNKAIITAFNGQNIGVLSGIYTGTSNCDLTINKSLNIFGINNPIFDGENTRESGWSLSGGCLLNVNNITFKNGLNSNGGAIYNTGSSTNSDANINIINCTFINNTATSNGGAIYNNNSSSYCTKNSIISNCTFIGNNATSNGGAIYDTSRSNSKLLILRNNDFLTTTSTNIYCGYHATIDNTYWNTSTPTSSNYNSTLTNTTPTNDRTTPNHPERVIS